MADWFIENGAVIGWVCFFTLLAWVWHLLFSKCRHAYYIRQAGRVYIKINRIIGDGAQAKKMAYLRKLNPYVFEELLLLSFEKKGFTVIRNKRYSGDGGVDGWVFIGRKRIPIQAKRYSSHIRRAHVEAFSLLVDKKKVPYGLFIHTGRTGKGSSVRNYPNLRMVSGGRLLELLKKDSQPQGKDGGMEKKNITTTGKEYVSF